MHLPPPELEREYQQHLGSPLPWRALGHPSLLALVTAMPEVLTLGTSAEGRHLLRVAPDAATRHIADMVNQEGRRQVGREAREVGRVARESTFSSGLLAAPAVSPAARRGLAAVLAAHPGGLPATALLPEYRRLTGAELAMPGFASVLELVAGLPELCRLEQAGAGWRLLPAAPRPWYDQVPEGELVELAVTVVRSPGEVCVVARAQVELLLQVEASLGEGGTMVGRVEVGARVAAPREGGRWGRAEVTACRAGELALVFLDSGERGRCREEEVREVPPGLPSLLPGLALRTALLGVPAPPGGEWPAEACRRLEELVATAMAAGGGALLGGLRGAAQDGRPLLWLVDSASNSLPDGIHINQVVANLLGRSTTLDTAEAEEAQALVGRIATLASARRHRGEGEEVAAALRLCLASLDDLERVEDVGKVKDIEKDFKVKVTPHRVEVGEEEVVVHTVALPGEGVWCSGVEVGALVPGWRGKDLLRKMLNVKKVKVKEKVVKAETDGEAMAAMAEWGVRGAAEGEAEVAMYRVEELPRLVTTFRPDGGEPLLRALHMIVAA